MKNRLSLCLAFIVLCASACAGVLGIRPPGRRPFEHQAHVTKGISCTKCHAGIATAGDNGALHLPLAVSCTDGCHEKPHDTSDCTKCHGLAETRVAAAAARENLHFDHAIHLTRTKGDCVKCHVDAQRSDSHLRPAMGACFGCHNHAEEMVDRKCYGCHVDMEREGLRPEEQWVHGPDFLKEHAVRAGTTGEVCGSCHADRFCTTCHAGGLSPVTPAQLAFDDPFAPSVHRAGFFSRHSMEARGQPGLCTNCHDVSACGGCHAKSGVGVGGATSQSPHPRGWLGLPGQPNDHGREAWRDPTICASCHGGEGEKLCVGCHRTGGIGGNPHPPGYVAHGDRNTDVACRKCHGGGL